MENTFQQSWLAAEIQLTYKSNVKPSVRPQVKSSRDAYNILMQSWDQDKIELVEQFKAMFLNRASKVLGILEVSSGSISATVADPRIIYVAALKCNACGVIIAHNHPSGNKTASHTDIALTKKLCGAGKFLEIPLLDHIILTTEGYLSFADEGLF
jgi:DNA repair protein RadC